MDARQRIQEWYAEYAPGLSPQPIPEDASVIGPLANSNPYGIQYLLQMPDGSLFPRHQSGPGVTVVVTDGERIILKKDFRPESGLVILKGSGGFAGHNKEAAHGIVQVYNALDSTGGAQTYPANNQCVALHNFIARLLHREYNGFDLGKRTITFVERPIGWPNIRICSIMGVIRITASELDECTWPYVVNRAQAQALCRARSFGDENADRLVRYLLSEERHPPTPR